ncbi:MAG: hypothetical protein Q9160_006953 [Pyrenula sp. 1 TL-2023]
MDFAAEKNNEIEPGIQAPQEAHLRDNIPIPFSTFNTSSQDLEAQHPPEEPPPSAIASSGILSGQSYGRSTQDEPSHAPRHAASKTSLRSATAYSHHAQTTTTSHPNDSSHSVADDLAWGPSHPCFPHLNPHVPLNSPEYASTRIIRIRRDWMVVGDLAPAFSNLYPEILDPLLPEQEFRAMIQQINSTLLDAFDPFSVRNWLDALLGFATGWFWEDWGGANGAKKKMRGLEDWLERWNQEVGAAEGVKIWALRRTGYTCLDVQIPDPKIRVVTPPGTAGRDESEERDEERQESREGEGERNSHEP